MRAAAVGVAVVLDEVAREPPLPVHPVVLVGRYLRTAGAVLPSGPPMRAAVAGGAAWAVGAAACVLGARTVERLGGTSARRSGRWIGPLVTGVALWPLFAHRLLLDEVAAVEEALAVSVEDGRAAVARIVSREVGALSEAEVRQAAIESLAENLSDSVVAPLLWFAVGGLPAAALYRYANTADASWGYRTPRWRYAGWVAARADDILNLVPARLTGLALALPSVPVRTLRREAARTPSPNSGWPMAALALRLRIELSKPGAYVLNAGGTPPTSADTRAALTLARRSGLVLSAGSAALAALVIRSRSPARHSRPAPTTSFRRHLIGRS